MAYRQISSGSIQSALSAFKDEDANDGGQWRAQECWKPHLKATSQRLRHFEMSFGRQYRLIPFWFGMNAGWAVNRIGLLSRSGRDIQSVPWQSHCLCSLLASFLEQFPFRDGVHHVSSAKLSSIQFQHVRNKEEAGIYFHVCIIQELSTKFWQQQHRTLSSQEIMQGPESSLPAWNSSSALVLRQWSESC